MSMQHTLSFRSVDGEPLQWREIWWSLDSDTKVALNKWYNATDGKNLLQQRQSFLSSSAEIYALKTSFFQPGQPKNTIVQRLFPTLRGVTQESDYLGVSIAFQLEIPGHRRGVSIRGISDAWVEDNQLTATGKSGIQKIISGVPQNNLKIVGAGTGYFANLQRVLGAGININVAPAKYTGNNIVNGAQGNVTITFPAGFIATLNVGDLIVITACPSMPLLRSTWKIASIDAINLTVTLAGSSQFRAAPNATCIGKAGNDQVDDSPWTVNVVGPRTRDTGRPTTGPRGRRSARIRHR